MIGDQLQRSIYGILTAANIAEDRVYDRAPASASFPYVTIGDEQVIDDGTTCADAWDVATDVHVWSRSSSGSKSELKTLVAQIVPLLATEIAVTGFRNVSGKLESSRTFRDPDGISEHAVLTFRYLLDPAS